MPSLRDIRKRIRSVKNTQQITKAMKMVAAAKLRKAQEAILAARPYAQLLEQMIADVAAAGGDSLAHELLTPRPNPRKVEVLVLTSDRGLAGGFNANVTRRAARYLYENARNYESIRFSTIGRKGSEFFKRRGDQTRKDYPGFFSQLSYAKAQTVAQELSRAYLDGEVDAVYVLYNEFLSAISQKVTMVQLLPFETKPQGASSKAAEAKAAPNANQVRPEFEFEPSAQGVLNKLVPQALGIKIYRALLESVASEHGARMSAMENATTNAADAIGRLTLTYNRTRQAVITKELMEIVSGAEALK